MGRRNAEVFCWRPEEGQLARKLAGEAMPSRFELSPGTVAECFVLDRIPCASFHRRGPHGPAGHAHNAATALLIYRSDTISAVVKPSYCLTTRDGYPVDATCEVDYKLYDVRKALSRLPGDDGTLQAGLVLDSVEKGAAETLRSFVYDRDAEALLDQPDSCLEAALAVKEKIVGVLRSFGMALSPRHALPVVSFASEDYNKLKRIRRKAKSDRAVAEEIAEAERARKERSEAEAARIEAEKVAILKQAELDRIKAGKGEDGPPGPESVEPRPVVAGRKRMFRHSAEGPARGMACLRLDIHIGTKKAKPYKRVLLLTKRRAEFGREGVFDVCVALWPLAEHQGENEELSGSPGGDPHFSLEFAGGVVTMHLKSRNVNLLGKRLVCETEEVLTREKLAFDVACVNKLTLSLRHARDVLLDVAGYGPCVADGECGELCRESLEAGIASVSVVRDANLREESYVVVYSATDMGSSEAAGIRVRGLEPSHLLFLHLGDGYYVENVSDASRPPTLQGEPLERDTIMPIGPGDRIVVPPSLVLEVGEFEQWVSCFEC